MKPKIMQEGPAALETFKRAMQAVFQVPKSAVLRPKPRRNSRKAT